MMRYGFAEDPFAERAVETDADHQELRRVTLENLSLSMEELARKVREEECGAQGEKYRQVFGISWLMRHSAQPCILRQAGTYGVSRHQDATPGRTWAIQIPLLWDEAARGEPWAARWRGRVPQGARAAAREGVQEGDARGGSQGSRRRPAPAVRDGAGGSEDREGGRGGGGQHAGRGAEPMGRVLFIAAGAVPKRLAETVSTVCRDGRDGDSTGDHGCRGGVVWGVVGRSVLDRRVDVLDQRAGWVS
ncbi:protein sak1 [Pneumocystis jirovecii RU7]|uniref:Protein sak1 n=1 Tax=Pneumocystis jirovecii (strain RU7) TaxID=1408657 RepID=A0A0W4ZFM3_PNEJ7|nr:protein sak1 [Pneumocystis jirovecii RU7]KTW27163.1 protein sak1 [Pneumocystis jirovecii RU7]